jgi:UDP-glucose:(heptosyl)LPS alpha-1,3-glucosyltransferase
MGQLSLRDKKIGLVVLGAGKQRPFERLARQLRCEDHIRFIGNQRNPIPYYQAADVYVQPTYYDPCSLVALEALACGLPVITTEMNGAGELLTPGREGDILTDPADVAGLANLMEEYLDQSRRIQAGAAARRLAERYSLDRNSHAIIELYRKQRAVKRSA